jgi:hypothetical protein
LRCEGCDDQPGQKTHSRYGAGGYGIVLNTRDLALNFL